VALECLRGRGQSLAVGARRGGTDALVSRRSPDARPAQHRTTASGAGLPLARGRGLRVPWRRLDCGAGAGVLREEFGIRYSTSQVSRILKALGLDPARSPSRGPSNGMRTPSTSGGAWSGPSCGRGRAGSVEPCFFVDESGSTCCRARSGPTPPRRNAILDEWQTRDHLSVMGGLTVAGKVYVLVRPEP